ncbi:hypothetical protein HBI04_165500 [Parastagonospora nodorum]|nr:hypothetical protein HBH43_197880 [Parastagonospora nodorum]KAH4221038.1 hypothetical protein HBI06_164430 [Parastagonospora nodorum]KAH4247601.1 hypothetical protein HBI05_029670 [Parastagonospora nodorum]KAH4267835.1 hypothetical protein HBI04_165500 [Parastagonospora nodorum]KAH4955392.1 hypothetical protein HBI78_209250 [Parastagonospora nodorum]
MQGNKPKNGQGWWHTMAAEGTTPPALGVCLSLSLEAGYAACSPKLFTDTDRGMTPICECTAPAPY